MLTIEEVSTVATSRFIQGIYASPEMGIMRMLDASTTRQDVIDNLQDFLDGEPDILDR